ncbi:hypothetical protein BSA16_34235, partial [Micromonospora sp. Rc5]|uniref:ATP-binding cassette domain-containing protein n=2 Tax=Actinomycetes TaxID=1760 RepID=UPI0009D28B53
MSDRETHTQSEEPADNTRQIHAVPTSAATDATAPPSQAETDDAYVLVADGLSVVGEEGPVFGPIDLRVPDNTLVFLSGRGGSGRTALALTLAGRMKPTDGTLTVFGHDQLKDIRDTVAIAGVDAIDALDRD